MPLSRINPRVLWIIAALSLALGEAGAGQVLRDDIEELNGIDIVEYLGETIPLSLTFTDDEGIARSLDTYFHQGKPVILTLAYYRCPMLCTIVLNGLADALREVDFTAGKEYQLLTVSINPAETSELAEAKRHRYLENLGDKATAEGWRFLVGEESQSKALADAVGFKYFYDEVSKEYAHPAAIFILTEEGVISRYLYGLQYSPRDVRLALLEASQGKIGNTIDRLILYCFHYDPSAKDTSCSRGM